MKKFLTVILGLFVVLFAAVTSAKAENIKFVQIADAHLDTSSDYSKNVLKSAVADINSQTDISFVVFTGDNINRPTPENLRKFVDIVSGLKVPYYVALGNHDVYKSQDMSKVRYFEILREKHKFYPQRHSNYMFRKDNFVFLIVDGAKEVIPGSVGYYRPDTLEWVDKKLTDNKDKQVVIFQHFPIEYPEGVDIKTHKTYRVEDYQELLEKHHNVLAVVTGHFHLNSESMKNGIYHISSPSIIAVPQSYKIIDIVTTKEFSPIIYTQLREFKVNETEQSSVSGNN